MFKPYNNLPLFPEPETPPATASPGPLMPAVYCGIAGWSYPDWEGYLYTSRTADKLKFIAGYVDMIEINNTFYRPPDARTTESWIKRTEEFGDFFFAAKLHQDLTHGTSMDKEKTAAFRTGLEPMVKAGRLRHILAQFRHDFADSPGNREHLSKISVSFSDMANVTLEIRHNSWQTPAAIDYLSTLPVTVANLDYPESSNSFNLRISPVGQHAYLRLHGRNAKAWFDKKAGRDETYNYNYSEKELAGIKDRAAEIAKKAKSLTIVANNHYQGKEVANCLQLKSLLSGRKVPVPPRLREKYPELKEIARD